MVARSRSMKRSMKRGRGRSRGRGRGRSASRGRGRMGGQSPCPGCPPYKGGRSRGRGRMGGMAQSPEHRGSPEAVYAPRVPAFGQPLAPKLPMLGNPNPPPRGGSRRSRRGGIYWSPTH